MRHVILPSGEKVPALGLGTWHMGESRRRRTAEAEALRLGLDLGMTLIDTAEMYGEGGAEEVVAEAMAGRRDQVFLVSKVYPHNASRKGVVAACERSLKRLATDRIDLYLLHWRGGEPLAETVAGFEALGRGRQDPPLGRQQFRRRRHGGAGARRRAARASRPIRCSTISAAAASNGICCPGAATRRIPLMAYSPLDQGAILGKRALASVAARHDATPAQIALAWLLRQDDVMVIPKASDPRPCARQSRRARHRARRRRSRPARCGLPAARQDAGRSRSFSACCRAWRRSSLLWRRIPRSSRRRRAPCGVHRPRPSG